MAHFQACQGDSLSEHQDASESILRGFTIGRKSVGKTHKIGVDAMASLEKKHQNQWAKKIHAELGIWSERIPDTPYLSSEGFVANRKPFDRLFCCRGVAAEFKEVKGRSFNIKRWKENPKTRHQFRSLMAFHNGHTRHGLLVFFWHPKGKRDIQMRFLNAHELKMMDKAEMDSLWGDEEKLMTLLMHIEESPHA